MDKDTNPMVGAGRRLDGEDMFLSTDRRSLHRGRRTTPRTDVCRPCLIWLVEHRDNKFPGVIMDMNPYGMLIRTLEPMEKGSLIAVQLMRDETYETPLAAPKDCKVVRQAEEHSGFSDHGVKILQQKIKRPETKPVRPERTSRLRRTTRTRMHTIDYTTGRGARKRNGR